MTIHLSI